jgi:MOSC domain-containing protein YiiM
MPQQGVVAWIGVRPQRRMPLIGVGEVEACTDLGLAGDRYAGDGRRQVTLIQAEHLAAAAAILGREQVDPGLLRRNVVVGGINLYALRDAQFRVGAVLLEGMGICAPCSRMKEALGPGGFNAMRGHGGITARVIEPGVMRLGETVAMQQPSRGDAE